MSTSKEANEAAIAKELRYLAPENIAEDFTSPREREAIAAVLKMAWPELHMCTRHGERYLLVVCVGRH